MKKVIVLFLIISILTTGCSYKVTSSSSKTYSGESINWSAEYKADQKTSFPERLGKSYVIKRTKDRLTVTYKNDVSLLAPAKDFKLSYEDVEGNGGTQTENSDTPIVKKEFRSGGGSGSSHELGDYLQEPDNLHKAIMIYGGPSYGMRTNDSITVSLQIDGKTETIILKPVTDTSPAEAFKTGIEERLNQMWLEKRYPELAAVFREQEADIFYD
jgi:hypothetical protein